MPALTDLHLRMTSQCNFNCRHCYAADWFNDGDSLDLETTLSTITQAQALGCLKVTFTGGEPLMSKVTVPAMKACVDRGLRVEIETNGLLLGKSVPELDAYLHRIEVAVSYDGDSLRHAQFNERVRSHIRTLRDLGCDLKIQTVLTEINLHEADFIFEFSRDLGIRNRVFLAHSQNGNATALPLLTVPTWLRTLAALRAKYSHLIIELPDVVSGGTQKKCGWGVHRCEIMPNGDVTSCGPITFTHRDFVAGNVKHQTLQALWNSPHFDDIRKLTQADFHGLCRTCPYWRTCLGACRSIAWAAEGTLMSPHPFCVALYNELERGTLDDVLLSAVPQARPWYEQIRAGEGAPDRDDLCEIVERLHSRVY